MKFLISCLTVITIKGFVNSELSGGGSGPRETNVSDYLSKRILNGGDAKNNWKFFAVIIDAKGRHCGAAVIRTQFLLTAAHCLEEDRGKFSLDIFPRSTVFE